MAIIVKNPIRSALMLYTISGIMNPKSGVYKNYEIIKIIF